MGNLIVFSILTHCVILVHYIIVVESHLSLSQFNSVGLHRLDLHSESIALGSEHLEINSACNSSQA